MSSSLSDSSQPSPISHSASDSFLCAALKQGSAEALGILYDRHASMVYGIALKVLGETQAAEDLTQDIFLTLTRNNNYNPSRGTLRTYLAILTRSRAMDRLRSKGTNQRAVNRLKRSHTISSANQPLEQASQKETELSVQTALSQLSAEERQVLQMMYFEGLTQAKVSSQLGIPLGTVKTRSRRALLKLRKILSS